MYAAIIEPFSPLWWTMNISVLCIGIVILTIMLILPEKWRRRFSRCLGLFLLFDFSFFEYALYYKEVWNIHTALPLQYCTIMEIAAGVALITKWQWLYEFVLFLGMIGPIQALITPAFPFTDDFFFYDFYLSHAAPIFVPIWLTIAEKMRPRGHAWWKTTLGFTLFATLVFSFNVFTGTNYMFLMKQPEIEHPFMRIGEWPYYIPLWLSVLFIWSFILNLFFFLSPRKSSI